MAARAYQTVAGLAKGYFEDRKSRFFGYASHVECEDDVTELRHIAMREIPGASHYVSAYLLHKGGTAHYSDAREPHGTAGMPVLAVIRHSGLEDVACVVARIFGGTLLGRGGLVRAYTSATKNALANARRVMLAPCCDVLAVIPYTYYDAAGKLLTEQGAQVLGTDFAGEVTIEFRVLAKCAEAVCGALSSAAHGQAELLMGDESFQMVDLGPGDGALI